MLRRLLASSRYLVGIAVAGTFAASIALMVYEALVVASTLRELFDTSVSLKTAKDVGIGLIEAVDVFLIAVTLYIISLSLYALFIDDQLPLPRWLEVHDLDDLKANLISVVIAVLAVLFLGQAVAWEGERDILAYGGALALVIASLTWFLKRGAAKG